MNFTVFGTTFNENPRIISENQTWTTQILKNQTYHTQNKKQEKRTIRYSVTIRTSLFFYIGAHAIDNNQWKRLKRLRTVYKRT